MRRNTTDSAVNNICLLVLSSEKNLYILLRDYYITWKPLTIFVKKRSNNQCTFESTWVTYSHCPQKGRKGAHTDCTFVCLKLLFTTRGLRPVSYSITYNINMPIHIFSDKRLQVHQSLPLFPLGLTCAFIKRWCGCIERLATGWLQFINILSTSPWKERIMQNAWFHTANISYYPTEQI